MPTSSSTSANRDPDEGIPLEKVEVGEKVIIPIEGYPSLEEDWGHCLVGCFTGRFPGIKAIEDLITSWGVQYCRVLRALRLRKNGDFVGKTSKRTMGKGKHVVEGDNPTTSSGQTSNKTRRNQAGNTAVAGTEATASVAARPKTASQSLPPKPAAVPSVLNESGAEGNCPGPTAKPVAEGNILVPEANRKKKKNGETPSKAANVELPCAEPRTSLKAVDRLNKDQTTSKKGDQRRGKAKQPAGLEDINHGLDSGPSSTTPKDIAAAIPVAKTAAPTAGQGDTPVLSNAGKEGNATPKDVPKAWKLPFKALKPPKSDSPDFMRLWREKKEILDGENKKIADNHNVHNELAAFNTKHYGRPEG
ncbi:unnamed protein product [Cuscuta campestris]|uniref:Uncharacterized protein n=1 Tax=Cuscuta campestris TaxID=132261 RepID=A0A484NIK8_9ASTE|nr:unnamed protein product [Cuscuta campestris]